MPNENDKKMRIKIVWWVLFVLALTGCVNESDMKLRAEIIIPDDHYLVRADVPIYGDAEGSAFASFKLEYGKGENPSEWCLINESTHPTHFEYDAEILSEESESVLFGNLGTWKTGLTAYQYGTHTQNLSGVYTLRLTVVAYDGRVAISEKRVTVGNVVLNARGGKIESDDGALSLFIQEHALTESARIFAFYKEEVKNIPSGYSLIGSAYTIYPKEETFLKKAQLVWQVPSHLESSRVGIYAFNSKEKRLHYLVSEKRGNQVSAYIDSLPGADISFVMLEKKGEPQAPRNFKIKKLFETQKECIVLGEGDHNSEVELFIDTLSEGRVKVDSEGRFYFSSLFPREKNASMYFQTIDEYGTRSVLSPALPFESEGEAARLGHLYFMKDWHTKRTDLFCRLDEEILIEGFGTSPNPELIDSVIVSVKSESDPRGIMLELIETGVHSGLYRGAFRVSQKSDQAARFIHAKKHNEKIMIAPIEQSCEGLTLLFEDRLAPLAPRIEIQERVHALYEDFERGFGGVARDGALHAIKTERVKTDNGYALKLTNQEHFGSLAVTLNSESVDVTRFPFLSFAYRMPQSVRLSLFLKNKDGWFECVVNKDHALYARVGITPLYVETGFTTDDLWHTYRLNLLEALRSVTKDFTIERIVLADWDSVGYGRLKSGTHKIGDSFWLDDVALYRALSRDLLSVDIRSDDDALRSRYELVNAHNKIIEANDFFKKQNTFGVNALKDGEYRVSAQSIDYAGNVSTRASSSFVIDTSGPRVGDIVAKDGKLMIRMEPDKSGIDPYSFQLQIAEHRFDIYSRDLEYQKKENAFYVNLNLLSEIETENGILCVKVLECADYARNALAMEYEVVLNMDEIMDEIVLEVPHIFKSHYTLHNEEFSTFFWNSDEGRLDAFNYQIDEVPDTTLRFDARYFGNSITVKREDGEHYLHLRLKDANGKWSAMLHEKLEKSQGSIYQYKEWFRDWTSEEIRKKVISQSENCAVKSANDQNALALQCSLKAHTHARLELLEDAYFDKRGAYLTVQFRSDSATYDLRVALLTVNGETNFVSLWDYVETEKSDEWMSASIPINAFSADHNSEFVDGCVFLIANRSEEEMTASFLIHEISFQDGARALLIDSFNRAEWIESKNAKIWINALGEKLYRFSDGFAEITTQHTNEKENGVYEISYKGVTPFGAEGATYCGWQSLLPSCDVSRFNALSMRIKGACGGERPNLYLSDGTREAYIDLEEYVAISKEWQTVFVPLIVFKEKGIDLTSVKELRLVFEWERMASTIAIDDIYFEVRHFPSIPRVEAIRLKDAGIEIKGSAQNCEHVIARFQVPGFKEWLETSETLDKDGSFSIALPGSALNQKIFTLQTVDKDGARSIPYVVRNPLWSEGEYGTTIEDFDSFARRKTWWDIDGTAIYNRMISRDSEHGLFAQIEVKKRRDKAWSFTALSIAQDGVASDMSAGQGLTLKIKDMRPRDLLLKLQDARGNEVTLLPLVSSNDMCESWTSLFYPFPKTSQCDTTFIKNILLFAYPGKSTAEGIFLIDDIRLY
jgi:hypothetical protein